MFDISVIIVNWNTKSLLLDCVDSLYRTTRDSSLEIIVVDNASTDGSVDALRKAFPLVRIIVNPANFGFAKANNIGIREAKGRYICLVNSDVKALDGVLDKMHAYMESHPEIGALAPRAYFGDMQIQKTCRKFPTLRNIFCEEFFLNNLFPTVVAFRGREMHWFDYETIMDIEVLSGCFLMVRSEVVRQVGLLDERFFFYSEDVDWCKRIHDTGWKLVYYPEAEAIHYGGGSSANDAARFNIELIRANWQYWKKHKSRAAVALFWLIKFTGTLVREVGWITVVLVKPAMKPQAKASADGYWKILTWLLSPGFKNENTPREQISKNNCNSKATQPLRFKSNS